MVQRGCDQLFQSFFWLVGGEVSGSQHHQPSGFSRSGVWVHVGTWWGFHYLQNSSNIVMHIPWGGTRTLPQGCTTVSWLFLPCLCIPSLPWLATVWTCLLELREGHGSWMKPISCNQRNGGHRKAFVPRSPTGPCLVLLPLASGLCQALLIFFFFVCLFLSFGIIIIIIF